MKEQINTYSDLYSDLSEIIQSGKQQVSVQVNSVLTFVYWEIGRKINEFVLKDGKAEYGTDIWSTLSTKLKPEFGKGFEGRNLRRMCQFARIFEDVEIVKRLSYKLSWSHFVILISIDNKEALDFYSKQIINENWSVRQTRAQIEQKAYERSEIASIQSKELSIENGFFKDPYFLDFLGLKDGYLENDLESAILKELELFILELGNGFSFVERQKRMIIDGEDFYLDLLFYHRKLKRLVAIELKIGKFKASHKGQLELYLKWLNKNEKIEGEEMPIGLILCTEASKEQVELLEMHKDGIIVAEYWTDLPPKKELENKLQNILLEVKERINRKRLTE